VVDERATLYGCTLPRDTSILVAVLTFPGFCSDFVFIAGELLIHVEALVLLKCIMLCSFKVLPRQLAGSICAAKLPVRRWPRGPEAPVLQAGTPGSTPCLVRHIFRYVVPQQMPPGVLCSMLVVKLLSRITASMARARF